MSAAIVFGTYQRFAMLRGAIASVRRAVTRCAHEIIVVDGGSTDGSREWLRAQSDVLLIEQELPLTGAVRAFNLGFEAAIGRGHDWIAHFNDDAEIVTPGAIDLAIDDMLNDATIGEVAFAYDLYHPGDYRISFVNGKPYANYGVIRREAGMAVARAQGDDRGVEWWNPIYRTYAADTELGCWMWRLGWRVHPRRDLYVRDLNAQDDMRRLNEGDFADSKLFWSRWRDQTL